MADASLGDPAVLAFIVLPLLLVAALMWGAAKSRRGDHGTVASAWRDATVCGSIAAAWMAIAWWAASTGILRQWDRNPPPIAFLVLGIFVLAGCISLTPFGRRLATNVPLWMLVGVQVFRFPLELAMHAMYERGIMPEQMSYSGQNFDIATGITAVPVAALVATRRGGRRLALVWNVLGLALLANVAAIAILSMPLFQYFGADRLNVWVTYPPFVWLPAVMVLAALAGHVLVFRALAVRDA